jgi:hypothetical protein
MDIETTRRHAEFLALEMLVVTITRALIESPADRQALENTARLASEKLTRIHPQGATAEYGDLLMGELQEAWAALMQRVFRPTA